MINPGVIYKVVGKYTIGKTIIGYHLVGEDGSQARESKERVIYLTNRGLISNLKIQVNPDNTELLRGKNTNITKLPVFDYATKTFQASDNTKPVSSVDTSKLAPNTSYKFCQYIINRRIMSNGICVGYEISSASNRRVRIPRSKVLELTLNKLISNATVLKYKDKETGKTILVLRGVDCNLDELPILIVDLDGSIIDPNKESGSIIRAIKVKGGGILKDNISGASTTFENGDYIVCNIVGVLDVRKKNDIDNKYKAERTIKSSPGDYYVKDDRYSMEPFGQMPMSIKKDLILNWPILKIDNSQFIH